MVKFLITDTTGKVLSDVIVAKVRYSKSEGFKIVQQLKGSAKSSKKIWSLDSNNFHKVSLMTLSPNHWDEQQVGNKHYIFALDGCINDEPPRGFFK